MQVEKYKHISVKLINYLLIIDQQKVAVMNFLLMADSPFSRHFFLNLNVYKKTNSKVIFISYSL